MKSLFAAATLAAIVGSANAGTLTLTYSSTGTGEMHGISYGSSASWDAISVDGYTQVFSGVNVWQTGNTVVKTFASQLFQNLAGGNDSTFDVVVLPVLPDGSPSKLPLGAIRSALLHDLYARYHSDIETYNDNAVSDAFQLAVWEITHENFAAADVVTAQGQLDLTIGAFQADAMGSSFLSYVFAQQMLFSLGFDGWNTFDGLAGLTNPGSQDQLAVVPLPVPAALAAIGLLVAARIRRRVK